MKIRLAALLALLPTAALAASLSVGVGGAWKTVPSISVGVGGAWKTVTDGYVGVGGVWKRFYSRGTTFSQTVSADTHNYDLSARAITAGWNGTDPLVATVTINSGVKVGSTSTSTASFIVAALPAGSSVTIVNAGKILGKGGDGGGDGQPGGNGTDGGPALSLSYAATINNSGGVIGGGGGGGGGGADFDPGVDPGGTGGGGQGFDGGGGPGNAGSDSAAGGGTAGSGGGGNGGTGGTLGANGSNGGTSAGHAGGTRGAGGQCKVGGGAITWTNMGTTYGTGC